MASSAESPAIPPEPPPAVASAGCALGGCGSGDGGSGDGGSGDGGSGGLAGRIVLIDGESGVSRRSGRRTGPGNENESNPRRRPATIVCRRYLILSRVSMKPQPIRHFQTRL